MTLTDRSYKFMNINKINYDSSHNINENFKEKDYKECEYFGNNDF
jgi:hypothetical protein